MHTRRREFVTFVGGAAIAWPLAAIGQPTDRVRRIGVLIAGPLDRGQHLAAVVRARLQELGWVEGRSLQVDYRWAPDADPQGAVGKELLGLHPDVILVSGSPAFWLREETHTVPIVFLVLIDPVGSGLVASLAHPGGNLTGFTGFDAAFAGKWLEMLKEIAPSVTRVAVLFYPGTRAQALYLSGVEAVALSFGVRVTAAGVNNAAEVEHAINAFAAEPHGGLIVAPSSITLTNRKLIIALAARHRLPVISPSRFFTLDGGLISYGVDDAGQFRQAAGYVDRILKGANPADLPVQQATKFELVINLKTAKALGLTVPPTLLARADEVIE